MTAIPAMEIPAGVRRLFSEGFQVADVAEPLASFDVEMPGAAVAAIMDRERFAVASVRGDGRVAGFIERASLNDRPCGAVSKEFAREAILPDTASLSACVRVLAGARQVFVTALGEVSGVVTRDDLQKPPARMWLFGMVTMIELRHTRLIRELCPDETWQQYLSPGRLEKARSFHEERRRRNRPADLLDCLQLSDKGRIVARDERVRGQTIFTSRRQAEDGIKMLENLRNSLAHAQDIITSDWDGIVQLAAQLDRLVGTG